MKWTQGTWSGEAAFAATLYLGDLELVAEVNYQPMRWNVILRASDDDYLLGCGDSPTTEKGKASCIACLAAFVCKLSEEIHELS